MAGWVRFVKAWHGTVLFGLARYGRLGKVWFGRFWYGSVWLARRACASTSFGEVREYEIEVNDD